MSTLFSVLQTTALAGLKVSNHPHQSLRHYYDRILAITAKMPEDAAYRVNTEAIINSRRMIVDQVVPGNFIKYECSLESN